jgi:hypothetical protein
VVASSSMTTIARASRRVPNGLAGPTTTGSGRRETRPKSLGCQSWCSTVRADRKCRDQCSRLRRCPESGSAHSGELVPTGLGARRRTCRIRIGPLGTQSTFNFRLLGSSCVGRLVPRAVQSPVSPRKVGTARHTARCSACRLLQGGPDRAAKVIARVELWWTQEDGDFTAEADAKGEQGIVVGFYEEAAVVVPLGPL